ncbi:SLC13 family permease [Spiribacter vilamensis]|uniref:Di/tricarboxylate transporter n=1 Tax=Spiribacter vilamensis TaxID=531306 RepID=A0A4Q8CYJ9_9GAMM|nr:SLC13 family permease [Spiribacter vilamensis]RZU98061.1 di/tricarboxylate transporter [Spiribacter vilamensis]TVO61037.1 SLC13 family permease [Spiribacter vilamensis]
MAWEGWLTIFVVLTVLGGLATGLASPVGILFTGLALLVTATAVTGSERLLDAATAVAGFGSSGLITVGLLFVVASGLTRTGAIAMIAEPLIARSRGLRSAQLGLLTPVAGLSAFLNNTPIVAVFLPVVDDLARRLQLPASRLYLPLSYAAILGGTCTLIGTSTNLIINDLSSGSRGMEGLGLFDLAWVGVPITVVGLIYLFTASPWLLPDRRDSAADRLDPRQYTVEVEVIRHGPLIGKTIRDAGLRHLPGLFLAEIERDGQVIPAVGPTERLQAGDRLVFVGVLESVVDLHKMRGLRPATRAVEDLGEPRRERCLVEAVVSEACPLVGRSIREGRFRERYQAAVIAVARGGRQLPGKIGDIVLRPGDTLLLETHASFVSRQRDTRDFYLVSGVEDSAPPQHDKAWLAIPILFAMVALAATPWMSMLNAALLAAIALVVTRCMDLGEAIRNVNWNVLLVIGAALGIGQAMDNSGAAAAIGSQVMTITADQPLLTLGAIYLLTMITTEMITNNAAAVLMYPIAMAAAESLGVSATPFAVVIMIAASAAFATPIGYQTNLMVFGPGSYRFSDYVRFGLPLNLIAMTLALLIIPRVWPL